MARLDDGQFEDIVAGRVEIPEDITVESQSRLASHRAIRRRLQDAVGGITAPEVLSERIRERLANPVSRRAARSSSIYYRFTASVAAAAVIIAAGLFILTPSSATAQSDLIKIHHETISGGSGFVDSNNPEDICNRLRGKCSTCIELPDFTSGSSYAGSRIASFRGQDVAAVLVDVEGDKITVISVPDTPGSLGFGQTYTKGGRTWCQCEYRGCTMAAVGIKEHTYIAVGEVSCQTLTGLLDRLVETH